MKRWVMGMRDTFSEALYELAKKDRDIILITSDTGAICHDKIKQELAGQYINVGIAEQNMIGLAAGMAMAGKKVFAYAIVPFATARCYEQIRVDLCCAELPVTVVGIGPGYDYSTLGPTHHGTEDIAIMQSLAGMTIYSPSDSTILRAMVKMAHKRPGPKYMRLDRSGTPLIYKNPMTDLSRGFSILRRGEHLCIIATGRMSYNALKVHDILKSQGIHATIMDLYRIKPIDEKPFLAALKRFKFIATVEEHFITGGIGSIINNILIKNKKFCIVKNLGIPDEYCKYYDKNREYLQELNGLDAKSISKTLAKALRNADIIRI